MIVERETWSVSMPRPAWMELRNKPPTRGKTPYYVGCMAVSNACTAHSRRTRREQARKRTAWGVERILATMEKLITQQQPPPSLNFALICLASPRFAPHHIAGDRLATYR